ncbi:MAG TPA: DUF1254 domain-containing protein [Bryobacteraceae bacterium]|jgi:hypothetical protein
MMRTISALLALLPLCYGQQDVDQKALGQQAYLFAYPLVLMDVTRQAAQGMNSLVHLRAFPTDKFRYIVRPNADTLYSNAWLDLEKEPMLLHVPDTHGRFYLMQIMDAWTETISAPGKRTTGTGEGWFAIVGPGWKGTLPAKATRIDCPTNMAWILGRTQTNGAADYENVHAIQDGYRLMPLSRYPDGVAASDQRRPGARRVPPQIVAEMSTAEFFRRFAALMKSNPPHAVDAPFMNKLAKSLDAPLSADFEAGAERAKLLLATIESKRALLGNVGPTGWTKGSSSIGRYGTNYLARAVVARIGLGANPPEDAVYLNCSVDAMGAALDGSRRYKMHFEKAQLPPVNAFWSITVYDPAGYFISNPIGRYAIGDRDKLKFNEDGSLDLYLQESAPAESDRVNNWLPSPKGSFNLAMRLYWPRAEILNGSWTPPAVTVAAP